MSNPFRVGHGFDLHRLEEGVPLIVGGVPLEHDRGCAGHSDGDVVYHAVTDAIPSAAPWANRTSGSSSPTTPRSGKTPTPPSSSKKPCAACVSAVTRSATSM